MDPGSIYPFDTLGLVVTAGDNNKKIAGSRAEKLACAQPDVITI
jgi:hypothetical protein